MTRATEESKKGSDPFSSGLTLVAGLGETGRSVARHLARRGARVLVLDSRRDPPGLAALRAERPDLPIVLESLDPRWLEGASRLVLSPGLGLDLPLVAEARRRGVEVLGDIELFAREVSVPVLAVTGSNGKSTVATLASRMLEAAGLVAPAGGNLGPPALELLDAPDRGADAYVLEISSFQMETTESLRPCAAAVLNVSADHLDRHGAVERYAALKAKLLEAAETAVFNLDDPLVRTMAEHCRRPMPFSTRTALEHGYSIVQHSGGRWLAQHGRPVLAVQSLALRGAHNEGNALAALALVATLIPDLSRATEVLGALETFPGLPHRCRLIAERAGVAYVDDSKGTNVGASLAALEGLPGPLILIAGGLAKGADFAPLAAAARGKVKAAVLIGQAAPVLERALAGVCPTQRAADMDAAVAAAARLASSGDTVLLSPACASQDMFRDYRERGARFAAAVEALPA